MQGAPLLPTEHPTESFREVADRAPTSQDGIDLAGYGRWESLLQKPRDRLHGRACLLVRDARLLGNELDYFFHLVPHWYENRTMISLHLEEREAPS